MSYFQNEELLFSDKNYLNYLEKKKLLQEKYNITKILHPPKNGRPKKYKEDEVQYTQEEHLIYKEYIKELLDLMYEPDGDFQKFIWDSMSLHDKETQTRTARGRRRPKIEY